ncbi:hypothetical protein FQN57_007291 [Myotisia sp. PD_48]|nr:hypothetical protein FQN57_007291 [Myotisia sp. PD_48]
MYRRSISNKPPDDQLRRSSSLNPRLPDDRQQSFSIQDVFSDEFSLEPLDGLDPSSRRHSVNSISSGQPSVVDLDRTGGGDGRVPRVSPFSDDMEDSPTTPTRAGYPSSAIELPRIPDTYNPPPDMNQPTRAASPTASLAQSTASTHRSSLTSGSRFSLPPRALSPYTGQMGASHPYAMYSQGTNVARTASISSNSTIRPIERNFIASAPPQHPYGLYSQTTVPEEAIDDVHLTAIPLGFRSHQEAYQPRPPPPIPNEVGDIVGPDGHLEQLPPYSRYPDGLPPKMEYTTANVAVDPNITSQLDRSPISPESRLSSHTLLAEGNLGEGNLPSDPTVEATGEQSKEGLRTRMTQKGKKKVCCGVPLWIFVVFGIMLVIACVIGGVIGGVLGAHQGEKVGGNHPDDDTYNSTEEGRFATTATVTVSTTLDATPVAATPTSLPTVPLGYFNLAANRLKEQISECIAEDEQTPAWQCREYGEFACYLEQDKKGVNRMSIESRELSGRFSYGDQNPFFKESEHVMSLMQDKNDMELGPAQFFYAAFDKLVIIPAPDFPHGDHVPEEELLRRFSSTSLSKTYSEPGDRPWFCWWNSTLLEVFLYVNETVAAYKETPNPYGTFGPPIATSTASAAVEPAPTPTRDMRRRMPPSTTPTGLNPEATTYTPYPRVIKIREMRFSDVGERPYCEQMQVMDDWRVTKLSHDPVAIIEHKTEAGGGISLNKTDPADGPKGSKLASRGSGKYGCSCEWFYN